ncbi:hypothetical protein [Actinomyces trachealis]|uniref:hypothetical protein n=1 Tax=Actinomyces trachealis TaxID=2763540 RepID=UPI0039A69EAD
MDTGLEALATALYVTVDDLLKDHPEVLPPRPRVGIAAVTSDAEIITLAVVQALLGYTSETRWIRRLKPDTDLRAMFPRVPGQSGYNKRVHSLTATMTWGAPPCVGARASMTTPSGWSTPPPSSAPAPDPP